MAASPQSRRRVTDVQATWGSPGKALGQLTYPEAVEIDHQGVLYVADRGNDRGEVLIRSP